MASILLRQNILHTHILSILLTHPGPILYKTLYTLFLWQSLHSETLYSMSTISMTLWYTLSLIYSKHPVHSLLIFLWHPDYGIYIILMHHVYSINTHLKPYTQWSLYPCNPIYTLTTVSILTIYTVPTPTLLCYTRCPSDTTYTHYLYPSLMHQVSMSFLYPLPHASNLNTPLTNTDVYTPLTFDTPCTSDTLSTIYVPLW